MNAQHTPGRLTLELVESDSGTIRHLCPVDKDGLSVLTVVEREGVKFAAVYLDDDARRLVACWNACEGISTEALESIEYSDAPIATAARILNGQLMRQRDELLAALKTITKRAGDMKFDAYAFARAAIAKAGGEA